MHTDRQTDTHTHTHRHTHTLRRKEMEREKKKKCDVRISMVKFTYNYYHVLLTVWQIVPYYEKGKYWKNLKLNGKDYFYIRKRISLLFTMLRKGREQIHYFYFVLNHLCHRPSERWEERP